MDLKPKNYQIKVIPLKKTKTDPDSGQTETSYIYERSTKPSENARAAGYTADKFFRLELKEIHENPLFSNPKSHTLVIFKNTHPEHYSIIKNHIENEETKELSDKTLILMGLPYPGLVYTKPCPPYHGTEMKNGVEQIRKVKAKNPDGTFVERDMIADSLSFFLFANECNEDGVMVAYNREWSRRKQWAVTANASAAQASSSSSNNTNSDEGTEAPE